MCTRDGAGQYSIKTLANAHFFYAFIPAPDKSKKYRKPQKHSDKKLNLLNFWNGLDHRRDRRRRARRDQRHPVWQATFVFTWTTWLVLLKRMSKLKTKITRYVKRKRSGNELCIQKCPRTSCNSRLKAWKLTAKRDNTKRGPIFFRTVLILTYKGKIK